MLQVPPTAAYAQWESLSLIPRLDDSYLWWGNCILFKAPMVTEQKTVVHVTLCKTPFSTSQHDYSYMAKNTASNFTEIFVH